MTILHKMLLPSVLMSLCLLFPFSVEGTEKMVGPKNEIIELDGTSKLNKTVVLSRSCVNAINLALRQNTRDHANDYKVFVTATEDMFVVFVQGFSLYFVGFLASFPD